MNPFAWIVSLFTKKPMKTPLPNFGWKFDAFIEGEDIVIPKCRATCFGGDNDSQDNGETASGVMTRGNPNIMGCALPISTASHSTADSPIAFNPHIPWGTPVEVEWLSPSGVVGFCVGLIDNGPAKSTGNGIDLAIAAARHINPKATASNFEATVSVRILGGAKSVKSRA